MRFLPFALSVLLFALCSVVSAAPNGLTQIPIAKVFGDGVAAFSASRAVEGSQTTTYTTQYGIGNIFEFGVDYQAAPPEQKTFLGNFKFLLAHRPGRLPDIAAGMINIATGQKAVPYVVATTQPSATGVSLGLIRLSGSGYEGMGGVSYNVTPTVEIVADEIGGSSSYATLGMIASLTKTISLNIAYAQPNQAASNGGPNPRGYVFNLSYVFHLKGGNKSGANTQNKNPAAGGGGAGQ